MGLISIRVESLHRGLLSGWRHERLEEARACGRVHEEL